MGAPPPRPVLSRPSSRIIVCGQGVPVDCDLYNFQEGPGFDATYLGCYLDEHGLPPGPGAAKLPFRPAQGLGTSPYRYAERSLMHGSKDFGLLRQIIRQFVLHHDGLFSARDCFHVLHDERGLSVHFIIDNDGTVYQTLDLVHLAYHATGVNAVSVGVEICNRGDYHESEARHYPAGRGTESVRVHDSTHLMWQFTDAQYQSLSALGRALHGLFPNLPPIFPNGSEGLIRTTIEEVRDFSGYLGHYHVTEDKWDPGCLDFARICQGAQGRPSWFLMPPGYQPQPGEEGAKIAEEPAALEQQAEALLRNNAEEAMGGFFPVGPCGDELVWHGGVHFSQGRGTPLYCPLPGRVVAARGGAQAPIGSCDFVLTQHQLALRAGPLRFFMLLFHVAFPQDPPWLARAAARGLSLSSGQVIFPAAWVRAGDELARVGEAGPPGAHEGQVHVEIFAAEDLGARLPRGAFTAVAADGDALLCTERDVLAPLGHAARPGATLQEALRAAFQHTPDREELTRLSARFQSEWLQDREREIRLRQGPLRALPNPGSIWRDQIEPTLWWTPEVARRLGLPADGVVWHYHPVTFLTAVQRALHEAGQQSARARAHAPSQASDGVGAEGGYLDEEDRMMRESADLRLEDLAEGWPDFPIAR